MRSLVCSIALLALSAVLGACYPGDISNPQETDIVFTGQRPGYTFQGRPRYFMPDTVVYLQPDTAALDTFDHEFDDDILNTVASNLSGLGYTRVEEATQADLLVVNGIAVNLNLAIWTWFPWWGPYWPCCGGGWYPWWPVSGVSAWRDGSVITIMVDPDLFQADEDNGEVWTGAINGLVTGSTETGGQRIIDAINQAFGQSPYLSQSGSGS